MLKRYFHLGLGGRDATILAMLHRTGEKKLMTHDEALKKVDWLKTTDPVSSR
ncbi:MAG: hypothetical protein ACHQ1H_10735 [Nitrososphaerales archaeon]